MKLRAKKDEGAVLEEELEEYSEGLICLTGGDDGPLTHALRNGGIEAARHAVERLTHIFGSDNVYVELQRHFHREQEMRNRAAIEIARSLRSAIAGHQRRTLRNSKTTVSLPTSSPRSAIIAL